jgi:hydrogenase nickel incorporation protein HypB
MNYQIIEVKEQLLADNDRTAASTRRQLSESGVFLVNLMGSPGAGKTSSLLQLISRLKDELRVGVMEADVDSDVDAKAVSAAGAKVIQLHTGGLCHMDAGMTAQGLEALGLNLPGSQGIGTSRETGGGGASDFDLIFLENVGNLVCPAEFDVGADLRMMILSVPEGDDKPLKYPLMFTVSDVMLVNKIDTTPIFDFDLEAASRRALALNPKLKIYPVSAKTGEGFDAIADLILALCRKRRPKR